MRTVETTGKTIEEAKQLAAEELGVPMDQIEFEILDEGAKSFLGLSRGQARVKATTTAERSEPAIEEPGLEEAMEVKEEAEVSVREPGEGLAGKTEGQWVLSMLEDVLAAANLEATPTLKSESDDEVYIDIEGPDVAILIGKHGQTLDALQYLLGVALSRAAETRARVTLDAEGYRDRYAQMLMAKAVEYARRVKETGEEAVLDPQPARDRRLMHMALADNTDVYTYSEGEGFDRHVVISPRK
ncbi:MAG: RNA-binding cell elongation regulator Jag/EloR [Armatimonadota bacterium]|nr:RNA-binding cell elongation regulator Jag/EloR [Armatimonadota bacterium]